MIRNEIEQKDRQRQKKREWRSANREKTLLAARRWKARNPEKIREYKKRDWEKNKERYRAFNREYAIKNREILALRAKDRRDKNKEVFIQKQRDKRAANPAKYRAYMQKHKRENPASWRLYGVRKTAKAKKILCDLDVEWFETRLKNGVCELSGLPFDNSKRGPNSPSVDRIHPSGNYTKDNCRMILWWLNRALLNLGEDYAFDVFRAIFVRQGEMIERSQEKVA